MAGVPIAERNQDATIYVGGLDEKVSEPLLWELFVQAGPVVNVHMPKDRITGNHQGYGFVEFISEFDADYAIKIMNMIKLYGKPIRVNKASAHQKNLDVGANVFIGNLDPEVDEKLLYDTFSAFGVILQTPKIMRDPETGNSKGYAFINFASFDASDAAIEAMNGQYLCNKAITLSYAFKKDAKGERHGSAAERLLAAQNPIHQADRPHQLFSDSPAVGSAGAGSNITSSVSTAAAQPPLAIPPLPPIFATPAQMPMMPPMCMPPIPGMNAMYGAEDPNMYNLIMWQQMQQQTALANPMAFNQPSWPPPPAPLNAMPPPPVPQMAFVPPPPPMIQPQAPPPVNEQTQQT